MSLFLSHGDPMFRLMKSFCQYLIVLILLSCASPVFGQNLNVFLGVNGSLGESNSVFVVPSSHYFPPSYSAAGSLGTYGATAGFFLSDRLDFHLEVERSRFRIDSQSNSILPQKSSSVTRGSITEYLLLVAYTVPSGRVSLFVEGGITPARDVRGQMTTTIAGQGRITTAFNPDTISGSPIALNGSLGLEIRKNWISVRPELRLTFWSGYQSGISNIIDYSTVFSSVQERFVVAVRFYPLGRH